MMLRTTIEKILPQIDPICDELGIEPAGTFDGDQQRNAHLLADRNGNVTIIVGELHCGNEHAIRFDIFGEIQSAVRHCYRIGDGRTSTEHLDVDQFRRVINRRIPA